MNDDRTMFSARIASELKRLIDADPRTNEEVAESAFWAEFGGRRKSSLERQIENKKNRLVELDREIEGLQDDRRKLKQQLDALKEKRDKMEKSAESYESDLDDVLDAREDDDFPRIIPETLSDIADEHGKSPSDVHDDIKRRAVDQGRDLTVADFTPGGRADLEDERTPISDEWLDGHE